MEKPLTPEVKKVKRAREKSKIKKEKGGPVQFVRGKDKTV